MACSLFINSYFYAAVTVGLSGGYFFPRKISYTRPIRATMNIPVWTKSPYVIYISIPPFFRLERMLSDTAESWPPFSCILVFPCLFYHVYCIFSICFYSLFFYFCNYILCII